MTTDANTGNLIDQPKILRITRLMDHMPRGLRYQATVEMFTPSIKARLGSALVHDIVVMPPFDDMTGVPLPRRRILISRGEGAERPIETALQEIDASGRFSIREVTDVDEVWLDGMKLTGQESG